MSKSLLKDDERPASWKFLLPMGKDVKVLICGGNPRQINSFARSYQTLDWIVSATEQKNNEITEEIDPTLRDRVTHLSNLEDLSPNYDVAIIADEQETSYELPLIITALQKNGLLIHVGLINKLKTRGWFSKYGFNNYKLYTALPSSSPRIFFPLIPKTFRNKCLSFHLPGSAKARIGLNILKTLSYLNITLPFHQHGIALASRHELIEQPHTLKDWLSKKLSCKIENMAIYCGSDSPKRKITLIAEAPTKDHVAYVIKIADTQEGDTAIRQETEALKALEGAEISCEVPHVFIADTWNSHSLQVQNSLPLANGPQITQLTDKHLFFLTSLSKLERKIIPLKETWDMEIIKKIYLAEQPYSTQAEVVALTDFILREDYPTTCHRIHGDFAPWNIRTYHDKLYIFDWEDSIPNGLTFTDIFHFLYRQASLVGPWPGGDALLSLIHKEVLRFGKMSGLEASMLPNSLSAFLLLEHTRRPHHHLIELITAFLNKYNDQTP